MCGSWSGHRRRRFAVHALARPRAGTSPSPSAPTPCCSPPAAYEKVLPFPGWTLPGVVTAGGAQAMLKGGLVLPGRTAVVAGTGPLLLPVAAGLAGGGRRGRRARRGRRPRGPRTARRERWPPIPASSPKAPGTRPSWLRHRVPVPRPPHRRRRARHRPGRGRDRRRARRATGGSGPAPSGASPATPSPSGTACCRTPTSPMRSAARRPDGTRSSPSTPSSAPTCRVSGRRARPPASAARHSSLAEGEIAGLVDRRPPRLAPAPDPALGRDGRQARSRLREFFAVARHRLRPARALDRAGHRRHRRLPLRGGHRRRDPRGRRASSARATSAP